MTKRMTCNRPSQFYSHYSPYPVMFHRRAVCHSVATGDTVARWGRGRRPPRAVHQHATCSHTPPPAAATGQRAVSLPMGAVRRLCPDNMHRLVAGRARRPSTGSTPLTVSAACRVGRGTWRDTVSTPVADADAVATAVAATAVGSKPPPAPALALPAATSARAARQRPPNTRP